LEVFGEIKSLNFFLKHSINSVTKVEMLNSRWQYAKLK